jgi:tetratricopeptide (TPR) repeat protein
MTILPRRSLLALFVALCLGGCGGEEEGTEGPPPNTPAASDPAEEADRSPPPEATDLPAAQTFASAQKAYDTGEYARAAALFERTLADSPEHPGARLGLAWALLLDARRSLAEDGALPEDTADEVRRAFEAASGAALGDMAWKVRLGEGLLHLLLGDEAAADSRPEAAATEYGRAEEILKSLLETRPGWNDLLALEGLARIARHRKDHAAVVDYLGRYLQQIDKSVRLWRDAIESFPRDEETWKDKVAETLPRRRPALAMRVESLLALGRPEEAEADAAALLELGRELEALERPSKARAAYASYLECAKRLGLPEHHEGVKEARSRIRALGR